MTKFSDDDYKRRQINYSILKFLWQLRQDGKKMGDFYDDEVNIERNRYTRILVNNENRKPKLGTDAAFLSDKSGVHEDIFLGKRAFTVNGITQSMWDSYCLNLRNSADSMLEERNRKKAKDDCRAFEKKLKEVLRETPYIANVDLDLLTAYYHYVEGKSIDGSEVQLKMQRIINLVQSMSFTQLESLSLDTLEEYTNLLKTQWEMISAIKTYKKYKNI